MSVFDKLSPQQRATAEKVKAAAQRHGIPEDLALAMAMQESTLTQNKASGTGPVGVMMLGKAAAKDMGIKNRFNEDQNIEGGVKYMKTLLKQNGGDVDKALVAYHDGPNSAFFKGGEMSPAAANHIQKVKGYAGMATPSATKSTSQFNIDADDVEPLESEYLHGGAGAAPANAAGRQRDITDVLAAGVGAVAGGKFGADKQSKHRELEQMRIEIANQKLDLARQEAARNAQVKPQNFGSGKDNWAANQYSEPIARTLMRDAPSQEAAGKLAPVLEARHQRAQQMFPGMQQAGPESMLYVPNQVGGGQKVMPTPAPAPVAAPIAPTPKMNFGSAAGHGANIIGGGVAGMQLNDALQRAQSGDYVGGGLSAVSGAGAAMATAPGWKNKLIGGGVAAGAAGLESLYDMLRGSQEKKQATPTPVPAYNKGGVIKKLAGAVEGPLSEAWQHGSQQVGKMSDWAQNYINHYIVPTQADRMGGVGGPSYSANSLALPQYQGRVWGSGKPSTGSAIANLAKDPQYGGANNQIFAPLLGSHNMHQSNQLVFDELVKQFYKDPSKMTPEHRAIVNAYMRSGGPKPNGKLAFNPMEGFDIADKDMIQDLGKTFDSRKAIAEHAFGGTGIGKTKSQLFDYQGTLDRMRDPMTADAPTFAVGPRAMRLSGEVEKAPRPDLNAAYPIQLHGEDLNVTYQPVPASISLTDFQKQWRQDKGKTNPLKSGALPEPGYYEHTLGYKNEPGGPRTYPRQQITEPWLKFIQGEGFSRGGLV
jgi:hypothetical protein